MRCQLVIYQIRNIMDNERAVNKVLRDMKSIGIIIEENGGIARVFLNALFVAGLEEGKRKGYAAFKKTVYYFDKNGKLLSEYESAEEAARRNKVGVRGIYNSIYRSTKIHHRNYWKYAEQC